MLSDKELDEVCTSIEKMAEMNDTWSVFPRKQLYKMFQELKALRKVADAMEHAVWLGYLGEGSTNGMMKDALAEWEKLNAK